MWVGNYNRGQKEEVDQVGLSQKREEGQKCFLINYKNEDGMGASGRWCCGGWVPPRLVFFSHPGRPSASSFSRSQLCLTGSTIMRNFYYYFIQSYNYNQCVSRHLFFVKKKKKLTNFFFLFLPFLKNKLVVEEYKFSVLFFVLYFINHSMFYG